VNIGVDRMSFFPFEGGGREQEKGDVAYYIDFKSLSLE